MKLFNYLLTYYNVVRVSRSLHFFSCYRSNIYILNLCKQITVSAKQVPMNLCKFFSTNSLNNK